MYVFSKTLKTGLWALFIGIILCSLAACKRVDNRAVEEGGKITESDAKWLDIPGDNNLMNKSERDDTDILKKEQYTILNDPGMTLAGRVNPPKGYTRTNAESGSLTEFIRNYPLKESGEEVHLYNGRLKRNQNAHAAVFALPIEEYDLQQCADSVMRVYAEYFWNTEQYEKIAFHFTNGFPAEYTKWREGYRIHVDGNDVSWSKDTFYDDSYECFVQYMRIVFTYSGTLSMETEAEKIELEDICVGDVFLKGGSPGHVVMVVDVCEDENGQKAFLLGQGYMPAQEFHLLKNNLHEEDPWYYANEMEYPFSTPEYTFGEGSLKRLQY